MSLRALHFCLASSLLLACASSPADDELGDETAADGEEGKGDAAGGFTFFTVSADPTCVDDATCKSFEVSRVNRSKTDCGDGSTQSSCTVQQIDWSGTQLPSELVALYEGVLHDDAPLLLRGHVEARSQGPVLAATELWLPNSLASVEGVFTLVEPTGIHCVTAPCPTFSEQRLNSNLSAMMSSVDFAPSGASDEAIEAARHAMFDEGIVVVGYRFYDAAGGKGRTANKFFMRAQPAPAPIGQVCDITAPNPCPAGQNCIVPENAPTFTGTCQ